MANLIFNQLPTELFVVIHNATKQLCKPEHLEAKDAGQVSFPYVLRSQVASHHVRTDVGPGTQPLLVYPSELNGLALESIRGTQRAPQT